AASHRSTAARHTVPAFPAACVHAGAPTVPLHTSVVHTLPSSVQLVPAALTVSAGQVVPAGASAMSWPMVAFDAVFAPVAPRAACAASALSEAVLVELEVWTWNRSVMPDGAPICVPPASPKQATSIVLATVPAGRLMASEVALAALPLLALAAPRNPMVTAPGQVSARSHSFTATRQTVPALPAGCVQVALEPLHTSAVHTLPSSVQGVP